ncbi:MAG: carboxyl transferase domain-containing protein [Dehalococcoidia bacterium]
MRQWLRTLTLRRRPQPLAEGQEGKPEEGVCLNCGADLTASPAFQRYRVCHQCRYHYSLPARQRIQVLADAESFREVGRFLASQDPLHFTERARYRAQVQEAQRHTGLREAAVAGTCRILGREVVLVVLDFGFLGGTMGSVVGEKVTQGFELAARRKLPLVTVVSSSGARLQEGILALMQAAKTVAAARRLHNARLPHICIMANPTTGGVYASFANLADFIIAEPGALVGFAPKRVVEEATGTPLPEAAHTAEWQLARGMIDQVVERSRQREVLSVVADLLSWRYRLTVAGRVRRQLYEAPTASAWQTVQLARHEQRPTALDYIGRIASSFVELRGDRYYGDDPAVVCGLAALEGEAVMIVAQQRPRQADDPRQLGVWLRPEGFRKARRAMLLAAKFRLPVIALIDTPGSYPGLDAEERGIGHAVAGCISTMADLPTPIVAAIIGEGGSEGALAFGVADRVLMLENAIYSVVSPEEAAALLYRDESKADEVASALKITAHDCRQLGVADAVVPEPSGGAHSDHDEAARLLKSVLLRELTEVQAQSLRKLLSARYRKFRHMGRYSKLRTALYRPVGDLRRRIVDSAGAAVRRLLPLRRQRPGDGGGVSIP